MTEVLYYPLLVTAPVRMECCRDHKTRTPDMVPLTQFWSSLPPVLFLISKKSATMAEGVGIMTEAHKSLTGDSLTLLS